MAEKRADIIEAEAGDALHTAEYPEWLWKRLEWFQDLKFGLFMHWGPYCQWGCIESWPLVEADTWARPDDLTAWTERDRDLGRFREDYWKLNETFNPTGFNPERWADLASAAGMTYMAFTTKHHDGFCMFDTATTDYRVTHPDCPFHDHPRANITAEVFNAFRARDMAISCYFSKSDWKCPWYWVPGRHAPDRHPNFDTHAEPEIWEQFVQFVHAQVKELMTDYGPIDALWLDGGQVRPPDQDIRMAEMAAMARRYQPGLIMADRTVGGAFENILTPEQLVPDVPPDHPWESCLTMGTGWGYKPNDTYKSTRELLHLLIDIVAKGGNLLLNIGPDPLGRLPEPAIQRLHDLAAWMEHNSAAIHGTRPIAPYRSGKVCFTRRDELVYAILLERDQEVIWHDLPPAPGSTVHLLGEVGPLVWEQTGRQTRVELPEQLPGDHAWVLTFQV